MLLLPLPLPWPPVKTNFNFFRATWVGLKARSSNHFFFPLGFLLAVSFRFTLMQQQETEERGMGIAEISPSSPKYKLMTILILQQRNAHLIPSDGQLIVQGDFSGDLRVAHLVQTVSVCLKSCSCTGTELSSVATWGLSGDWSNRIPVHSFSLIQKSREMPVLGFIHLGQYHECTQHHSLRKSVITNSKHQKLPMLSGIEILVDYASREPQNHETLSIYH